MHASQHNATLLRRINLPLLTLYGLGTILGAGIYVLVGKVVGNAGYFAPVAFLLAAVIAGVTAMSYAQLSASFPKSAGEVVYVNHGLKSATLSSAVGWLIITTGIVSSATLCRGFAGYLTYFIPAPSNLSILLLIACMTAIAIWGIAESLWIAGLMTLLEIAGLAVVIGGNADILTTQSPLVASHWIPTSSIELTGIFSAAFIAFYAFIGFEDMVNIAEEVKRPARTLPLGIAIALLGASVLYFLVAHIAVSGDSHSLEAIAESDAPLTILLAEHPRLASFIVWVSLFATLNGMLIQMIMGSRVLYGMARNHNAPKTFALVNETTHTPARATIAIGIAIAVFALWLPIEALAKLTSFVVLIIFSLVNLSLWKLKRSLNRQTLGNDRHDIDGSDAETPLTLEPIASLPLLGLLLCIGLLLAQLLSTLLH